MIRSLLIISLVLSMLGCEHSIKSAKTAPTSVKSSSPATMKRGTAPTSVKEITPPEQK